jgi:ubiquinone/menaquinone biosynthesis C-methylase UbiE
MCEAKVEDKLKKLLKFGVSYADAEQVLPPVGTPSEFIDKEYLARHNWWKEEQYNWWRGEELDYDDLIRRDRAPMPGEKNRELYFGEHHLAYWLSGYRDYRKTLAAVEPYGICSGRCYDFGGSTGRVFRHFAFQSDKWDVWSSDFKISSVEWNLRYFPTSIKVLLNNSNPSLPLPDNYFDLVTAYSVFTHINEPETSWLLELRRILKIGSVAYISIHDEATWSNPEQSLRDTIVQFRPDIADLTEMPKGKTVVTWTDEDPYNCNVFHSREHIESVWGRYFEICEIKSCYLDRQAVVVCRRPD